MKKLLYLFVALCLFFISVSFSMAQLTYNLTAKNFSLLTINEIDDALEFDIYLENTTIPAADIEFASGQYYFYFNPLIASGNTDLVYSIVDSDFLRTTPPRPDMIPRNPSVGYPPPNDDLNVLCLAFNIIPGAGNGFILPPGFPGIKIVRVQLLRLLGTFNIVNLDLIWKGVVPLHYTRVFAYIGTTNTEITTPSTHTIDCPPAICTPLPVELASFTSSVNKNNVTLNWTTVGEINNQGFDIERKSSSSSDWAKVTNISGNGTTNEQKRYTFNERINTGKYNYRLKQIDYNGNYKYYNLSNEVEVGIPATYNISQNYPNPFNPTTKIDYDLPNDGKVNITLYDISGREIALLLNEVKTAGYYTLEFNALNLSSGIYFYRMNSENFVASKKLMLLK